MVNFSSKNDSEITQVVSVENGLKNSIYIHRHTQSVMLLTFKDGYFCLLGLKIYMHL